MCAIWWAGFRHIRQRVFRLAPPKSVFHADEGSIFSLLNEPWRHNTMLRRCNLVDVLRDEDNLVPAIDCAMTKRNDSTAQQKPLRRCRTFFPGGFVVDRAGKASAKPGCGVVPLRPQQVVDAQLGRLVPRIQRGRAVVLIQLAPLHVGPVPPEARVAQHRRSKTGCIFLETERPVR